MELTEKEFLAETIKEIKRIDVSIKTRKLKELFPLRNRPHVNHSTCSLCDTMTRDHHRNSSRNFTLYVCIKCSNKKISTISKNKFGNGSCNLCKTTSSDNSQIPFKNSKGVVWHMTLCKRCTNIDVNLDKIKGEIYKIEEKLELRLEDINETEQKGIDAKVVPENNIVKSYVDAGLAETFAIAIVKNEDSESEILDLWEADWWKQYPADDVLVCAVLDGKITEAEGKWLNSIRSDHMRLALASVEGQVSIEWSRALLDAGFINYPEAVNDVLNGGKPSLIARIRKLDVDQKVVPMQLENRVSESFSNTENKN